MEQYIPEDFFELDKIQIVSEPEKEYARLTMTGVITLLNACFDRSTVAERKKNIDKIMSAYAWHEHYKAKLTGRRVLAETDKMQFPHELPTAVFLAQAGYDVIFAPKAMFAFNDKKFDIFLIKGTSIIKADLKHITTKNANTIAIRIKYGSDQASRLVIDISSDINKKELIDALRRGVERNSLILEVLLIYKNKYYRLQKHQILRKEVYNLIK